jgi:hypothetical protein
MIAIKNYIIGGKATFTVVSPKTSGRYTFRVTTRKEPACPFFVKVRGHGENNWNYIGIIPRNGAGEFKTTARSTLPADAPEVKAIAWVWRNADNLDGKVEFLPSGKCCRCGRQLTTPESIAAGIGPECAGKL